ncbi:MAG: glycoside hydrolase family 3 N-terminal domain-containing protein [Anaerolineales bacterium]
MGARHWLAGAVPASLLVACLASPMPVSAPARFTATTSPPTFTPETTFTALARTPTAVSAALPTSGPLPALTLDQKIGLLLLAGINGAELTRETRALISEVHVGGVVLRGRNVRDAAQLARLITDLQAVAAESGQGPLFVAMDQEGGDVSRLQQGVTHFPSPMALGAAGDPALAYQVGFATAGELLVLGVNVNLAPSLDVLTNPDNAVISLRSFGSDPARVAQLGLAFVRGTLDAGAIPVAKHYPGHGSTSTDSHAGLPQIETLDTAPFEAAMAEGAPVVMVGHLWASSLDPAPRPASLSPNLIFSLRQKFEGVILTDSLNMGAISNQHTAPEAAVLALQAGADWLLVAEPGDVPATLQAIRAAIARGELSPERLDASVRRLLALRTRLSAGHPAPDLAANHTLAQQVAQRALALTCASAEACAQLPIPPSVQKILLLAPSRLPSADAGENHFTYLAQLVSAHGHRVTELLYDLDDPARNPDYAAQAGLYANASDLILFGAWDAHLQPNSLQAEALRQAQASGHPVIVLGLHLPFDLPVLRPEIYLATFGDTRAQMEAIAGALFGEFEPMESAPRGR